MQLRVNMRENSKSETRNPKQYQNLNFKSPKRMPRSEFVLYLGHSIFEFVSCFDIRDSDFSPLVLFKAPYPLCPAEDMGHGRLCKGAFYGFLNLTFKISMIYLNHV